MNRATRLTATALLGFGALWGCSTAPPRQTPLMRTVPNYKASSSETRTLIRSFAQRFAQVVEGAADEEYYSTEDPEVRSELLLWKSRMVPLSQGSCYLPDPLAALIDTWALCVQQREYVAGDRMRSSFGSAWGSVMEAASTLEQEIEELAARTVKDGDIAGPREYVNDWAAAHPIDPRWMTRQTMVADRGEVVSKDDLGALAQLAMLTEEMNDLTRRLSLYGEFMPRQARWQAEIMASDLGVGELTEATSSAVPELVSLARQAVEVLVGLPALVDRQRALLTESIAAERAIATAYATAAREEVEAWLSAELDASLDRLSAEREAAIEGLDELVRSQWPVVRDDLPAVGSRTVEDSVPPLEQVVDHAFVRLAQLLGAALALAFVGALLLVVVAKR